MKKFLVFLLALALLLPSFCSCETNIEEKEKITIVTTVFPEYDWVRQILGDTIDQVNLVFLTENGTDLHSYQPTVRDIATISQCDILIHTGGISDAWIEDALALDSNKDRRIIRLMDVLEENERLTEQTLNHHENHDHDGHVHEFDEHVWLSPKLAPRFCKEITRVLCEVDPAEAETYQKNCQTYVSALQELDKAFSLVANRVENHTVIFADRFPFSYLMHDYGISCISAFPGCSSETEASFHTVVFLAEQLDKLSLSHIIVLESSDKRLAKTVIATANNKNTSIITMDSMQSISKREIERGETYINIMERNLDALSLALEAS